jgi:hypothetical protein
MRSTAIYNLGALVIILFSLSSCTKKPNADLIGNGTCSPPCWMNIRPGATKVNDAIEILKNLEKEGQGHFTLLDSGIIEWRSTIGKNTSIYSDGSIVTKIELDLRTSSTDIKDIISIFGSPYYFQFEHRRAGGYYYVDLFYPNKGLVFLSGGNTSDFVIEPNMVIIFANYLEPSDITTMVKVYYPKNTIPDILKTIQKWKGYGNITP